MAQLKNNDLTRESITNRLYRLMRLQNNIDTHAVELGITGPLLAWAQNGYNVFSAAVTASTVEAGESKDATIIVRAKFATTQDYYQKAKDILIAYLAQYKPDDILLASYRVDRPTPRKYLDLAEVIDVFEETHNRLVSAGDDRVIAQGIIDELVARGNDFEAELDKAGIEKRESDVAYQEQQSIYNADTEKLRLIYKIACMVWGDDDPKLKDLGFVPSSEIWTPGQPEPGVPVHPEAASFEANYLGQKIVELVYGPVFGAVAGVIRKRKDDGVSDWEIVIEGLPMNDEDRAPFRDTKCKAGEWEYEFVSYDSEDNPSEPSYATVTVPE